MNESSLLLAALFFTLGLLLSSYFHFPFWVIFLFALLFCLLGFCLRQSRASTPLLSLVLLSLGMLRWELAFFESPLNISHFIPGEQGTHRIIGMIDKDETLRCLALKRGKRWEPVSGRLRLFVSSHSLPSYGEEVMLEGDLKKLRSPGNPGEFDLASYLNGRGIDGILKVRSHHGLLPLGKNHVSFLARGFISFRQKALRQIYEFLPPKEASLFGAMVVGDRTRLEGDLWDLFTRTGTVHLLSISGLHVGVLAALLYFLLKWCWMRQELSFLLTLLFLVGFSAFVGGSPPVVRATVMIALYLLGSLLGREVSLLNTLSFAYLALLLWNPFSLFEVGFQLSFLSVFFLFLSSELCKRISLKATSNRQQSARMSLATCRLLLVAKIKGVAGYAFNLFLISVGVWIGIWPVVAYHFYVVSPVSWIANLFVIPLLFPIVGVGILWLLLGQFVPVLSEWLLTLENFFISLLIHGTKIFDKIPFGSFHTSIPGAFLFLYYAILGVFLLKPLERFRWKAVVLGLALCNFWVWSTLFKTPKLEVTFLNVGHGDAIFLQFPGRGNLLMDGGDRRDEFDAGRKIITPFLRKKGIHRLDAVLVTHADQDHVGGIPTILETFHPTYVFESGFPKENVAYRRYQRTIETLGLKPILLQRGQKITGFPDVHLEVLHPPHPFLSGIKKEENNNGVVLRLTHGENVFLFTADIQEDAIRSLEDSKQNLDADILKMPHHGGDLGKEAVSFLKAVSPDAAVISVGERETYNLPSPKIISLLDDFKIPTYQTLHSGAIRMISEGRRIQMDTWRGKR
ncbi:MAG: DNA internalization-related competence protein ComEC/Rec2 [Candidatus Omnitrophica bacterium]|nr:DNA internalization-related competence protein ComEC/Rec2 [Candidatus Omnitrophota bacterium]